MGARNAGPVSPPSGARRLFGSWPGGRPPAAAEPGQVAGVLAVVLAEGARSDWAGLDPHLLALHGPDLPLPDSLRRTWTE